MRLHELRGDRDVVVKNEQHGHVLVVTPEGAVYDDLDTSNVLNMAPAFGILFDDGWRLATNAEKADLYRPKDKLFHNEWSDPPERSPLRAVK